MVKKWEKAVKHLRQGIFDVASEQALAGLTPEDWWLLVNGVGTVDVAKLTAMTTFNDESNAKDETEKAEVQKLQKWLWEVISVFVTVSLTKNIFRSSNRSRFKKDKNCSTSGQVKIRLLDRFSNFQSRCSSITSRRRGFRASSVCHDPRTKRPKLTFSQYLYFPPIPATLQVRKFKFLL